MTNGKKKFLFSGKDRLRMKLPGSVMLTYKVNIPHSTLRTRLLSMAGVMIPTKEENQLEGENM